MCKTAKWLVRRVAFVSAIALYWYVTLNPVSSAPPTAPATVAIQQQSTAELLAAKLDEKTNGAAETNIDLAAKLDQPMSVVKVTTEVSSKFEDEQSAEIRQSLIAASEQQHAVFSEHDVVLADKDTGALHRYPLVSNTVSAIAQQQKIVAQHRLTNKSVASVSQAE